MKRHRLPGTRSRALYVLPSIPEDAPAEFKNALAIRNAASTAGVCPACGVRGELSGPDAHGIFHMTFQHADGCGALLDGDAA